MTRDRQRLLLAVLVVALVTAFAHWPAIRNGMVMWDDDQYMSAIQQRPGIGWVFRSLTPFYYHPLTWLSHIADVKLFGNGLAGPHAVNVLLHAVNAGLVVWLVSLLLGAEHLALAAGVGIVFGIHPIQVESVAWLAERKNVLCGLFCVATLIMYLRGRASLPASRCSEEGSAGASPSLWWVVAFFIAALLSKPMAVSLPVVMLVLDQRPKWRDMAILFAMAGALAIVTFIGQHQWGAVKGMDDLGLWQRSLVAVRGFTFYLRQLAWPVYLCPYYPLGGDIVITRVQFWVPAALFIGISVMCVKFRKLLPAWVAFVALVLPVSGLVQVGPQAAADRFMYLAILPVAMVTAGGCEWFWRKAGRLGRVALGALLGCVGLFYFYTTREMIGVWRNEETLWRRVMVYYPQSGIANFHLAMSLLDQGRFEEGLPHAEYAAQMIPENPLARMTLGVLYLKTGHPAEAVPVLRTVPDNWSAQYNLACAYCRLGKFEEAFETLRDLLHREPQRYRLAERDPELKALREHPGYVEKFRALNRGEL